MNEKGVGSIWPAVIFVVAVSLCFASNVEGGRSRSPVIFNMGDSNSDTGSVLNGFGFVRPPPFGRLFHRYVGRVSDGRLIIDFLCEFTHFPFNSVMHFFYQMKLGGKNLSCTVYFFV